MKVFKKALVAAGVGLVGALGTALLNGDLTMVEALASLGTGLLAGVAVYSATNETAGGGTTVARF